MKLKQSPTLLFVMASIVAVTWYRSSDTFAAGTVTIVGVARNHSSVKVYYNPVAIAKDYRVYDVSNPNNVKYAGLTRIAPSLSCPGTSCFHHFALQSDGVTPVFPYQIANGPSGGPQSLDVPATSIDWNGVGDGNPHTLVVEAVDRLGPVPHANLYDGPNDTPLVTPQGMLGGNKGPTGDGKISTNGQGPYSNIPQVIAQSSPFVVQANRNFKAIPSKSTATQTFFDTFEDAENSTIGLIARNDSGRDSFGNLGTMKFTMNAGSSKAWEIEYRQADNINSMPFISNDHFMDMLFDGATPGTSAPTHTIYASMSMTPTQAFDISNGKVAHLTMEVDSHWSFRRWLAFNIAPASDPLQAWGGTTTGFNNTDQGIFLEIREAGCALDIFTRPISSTDHNPTGTAGGSQGARLWGGLGSVTCGGNGEMYVRRNLSSNGLGLDDKSRLDLFISESHVALFQDGQLIQQSDIPAGSFPWANLPLRAYYTHYLYHSEADIGELLNFEWSGQNLCYPLNSFWFNHPVTGTQASQNICSRAYPSGYGFQNSDERHWDNMGFEVLPASDVPANNFSSLAALVQPPPIGPGQSIPVPAPTNLRIVIGLLLNALFPVDEVRADKN